MQHYTYVIHKESTGEYYIGVRSCEGNPNEDSYMGSSKILNARLHEGDWSKYVIQQYPTREEAGRDEFNLTENHLQNGLCLNQCRGGTTWKLRTRESYIEGGLRRRGEKRPPKTEEHRAKLRMAALGKPKSEEHKRKIALAMVGNKNKKNWLEQNND